MVFGTNKKEKGAAPRYVASFGQRGGRLYAHGRIARPIQFPDGAS